MYRMTYDSVDHSIKYSHCGYAFLIYPLCHRCLILLVIMATAVPFFLAASPQVPVMNNSNRPNGTARLQFNTDDDVDLKNISIDVLSPLYNRPNTMLFTQLSGRHRDSRDTLNIGAGVRMFTRSWMYGINTFFDNDFTGTNRRMSLGAELWTNYIKLSSNLYYRIKNWSHSPDFDDIDERPAYGYDMRGDAYLPFYPQLGARMVFEKYYGYGVALFDKNKQLDSPRALIVGLNYTPIPLLTLAVEQRVGSGDQSEDRISLQINYRLGLSWREQFNPQEVASIRTLAVSRYDAVERNGDMVLDYRH